MDLWGKLRNHAIMFSLCYVSRKMPHNKKIKNCIYVQNERNKIDESFDCPQGNQHNFYT